jgi:hypothetical protein
MRSEWTLGLLLAALLWTAVPAGAQPAASEPAGILEDVAGDVRMEAAGTDAPSPASTVYSSLDLVSLSIAEDNDDFTFVLGIADLKDGTDETALDGLAYEVLFTHNGRQFRLGLDRFGPPAVYAFANGILEFRDSAEQDWSELLMTEDVVFDASADTVTAEIPREALADAEGAEPYPGRMLGDIAVQSYSLFSRSAILAFGNQATQWPVDFLDDMPEADGILGLYAVQVGVEQEGNARLMAAQPFRASNGEATTFVYQVRGRNLAAEEDTFTLVPVQGPGSRLEIVLPIPTFAIPGKSTAEFPVLVTAPFGHDHGDVDSFILEMRSNSDPGSVGRLEMGVRYLDIAQPAGHHDTLYIHTASSAFFADDTLLEPLEFGEPYMNTLAEDPDDTGLDAAARSITSDPPGTTYTWSIPLSPALQMGMDFDLGGLGHLALPIGSPLPLVDASVSATLHLGECDFCLDSAPLATMAATDPVLVEAGSTVTFEGDLVPTPDGNFIPYEPGMNLILQVSLSTTGAPSFILVQGPAIKPGGELRLPLFEYHDPVDEAFASLAGPHLMTHTQQRWVNPGETTFFEVTLHDPGEGRTEYELSLAGINAEWARVSETSLTPAANGTRSFLVVVEAPEGAVDGERVDVVVQATAKDDPANRGLVRLVAEVDTETDHEDLAGRVASGEQAKGSPGPALPLVLALLVLVALGRRR